MTREGRDAFDLLPEAVVLLDLERTVVAVNDRAAALLGLDPGVVGHPVDDVLDLRDDAGNRCTTSLAPSDVGRRLAERILRVALSDGRARPVAVTGRFVPGVGTTLTFRSAGRRERVDAARSDLVATVSHEIRSPLTSVKGFTRTLLARWDRFSDEQKRTMLETVDQDADRVTRLLTELLDVSRIDAGRVRLHRRAVDVAGFLPGIAERAQHRPEGAGRDIVVDAEDGLPPVQADVDKLEQILTNLVQNALQYAPEGPVELRAGRNGADSVVVTVVDHGPGIPEEQRRRVFEKFGRGGDQRRAGTGLGLYIVRGLVQAHGGDVWCDATPGGGARFHLTLPT